MKLIGRRREGRPRQAGRQRGANRGRSRPKYWSAEVLDVVRGLADHETAQICQLGSSWQRTHRSCEIQMSHEPDVRRKMSHCSGTNIRVFRLTKTFPGLSKTPIYVTVFTKTHQQSPLSDSTNKFTSSQHTSQTCILTLPPLSRLCISK
jgi:hypothetical protein